MAAAASVATPNANAKVGRHALFGEVRDAAGGPINGAVVEILSGLNAGRATMSGSGGQMGACRLTDLIPGTIDFRTSKDGFSTETFNKVIICSDVRIDVTLNPVVQP